MLHTRIEEIDDDCMTRLLNEISLVCELQFMNYCSSTVFSFFELCYAYHDLKGRAKLHPSQGVLNTNISSIPGAAITTLFLREYCSQRGVLFEGYESRKLHCIISALAPKRSPNQRKTPTLTLHERSTNLIKLRRSNGDL